MLQHHFLFYFEKEQDFEACIPPKGAIPVAGARVDRDTAAPDPAVRCTFYVVRASGGPGHACDFAGLVW